MTEETGTPESMRKINRTLLYHALIELRTATRAELAEQTRLSTTTVRALLEERLQCGEISVLELDESSGGRRAQRYTLNPERNLILALYFEETKMHCRISGLMGNIVYEEQQRIEEDNARAVIEWIRVYREKFAICAIGLGVPGIVENGRYYVSGGADRWMVNTIGEEIERTFDLPVLLENDLNSIALGFALEDCNVQPQHTLAQMNLVYIHFNRSCVGAGVIADGRVIHGAKSFAGELGFLPLEPGKTLDRALHLADSPEKLIEIISQVISIVNCVTNPSLVVIGGERVEEGNIDFERLKKRAKQYIGGMVQPEIAVSFDCRNSYLTGLTHLTLEKLLPRLPIKGTERNTCQT